jgi:hypothetical protein
MTWVGDYTTYINNEDNKDDEMKPIYEGRLNYVQNCLNCSVESRNHILLNELWRNKNADTHEKYLKLKKENAKLNNIYAFGEEGDNEAKKNRDKNIDNDMADTIDNLRAKFGDIQTKEFYGDRERVENIRHIFESENNIKNKDATNCISNINSKTLIKKYNDLKKYEKNDKEVKKKKENINDGNIICMCILNKSIYTNFKCTTYVMMHFINMIYSNLYCIYIYSRDCNK